jgi:predicted GNAT superfamily acetyltransferase
MSHALDEAVGQARAVVELAETERDARAAGAVLSEIWPQSDGQAPIPPELIWALAHSGNYVAIARDRDGGQIVGASAGFRAHDEAGGHLHSHVAGVLPGRQDTNIGFLLKQHQRSWARDNGLGRVTWTFDPLVARNAYFNVSKLGAQLTGYHVNFYGEMTDAINDNDESDRCLMTWSVADDPDRTTTASGGWDGTGEKATTVLSVAADGSPRSTPASASGLRIVQVPRDIVSVRKADPAQARAWRSALRDALLSAFADGLQVIAVTRESCYVLARSS